MDNTIVKKITFSRDMTDRDFSDIREMLGHKPVEDRTRHIVVVFDDEQDYFESLFPRPEIIASTTRTTRGNLNE